MRFDCHTHVFNLLTASTPYAARVFLAREDWKIFPGWLNRRMARALRKLAEESEGAEREDIVRGIVEEILEDPRSWTRLKQVPIFRRWSDAGRMTRARLRHLPARSLNALVRGLDALLGAESPDRDVYKTELSDFIRFAEIAFKPRIAEICEDLFDALGPDHAVIALMMDITDSGRHERTFIDQMRQTSQAILRHPGRFFPFVAVNPRRRTGSDRRRFLTLMKQAAEEMGFVGVKLYPSLGHAIDAPGMRAVYDYCLAHDLPITMHCNPDGFTPADGRLARFADPVHWGRLWAATPRYRALKLCFAHFGGDEDLCAAHPLPAGGWTAKIVELMKAPDSRVYADVSYHTAAMLGGRGSAAERIYFQKLGALMEDAIVRDRLLFGSDHWMVRVRCAPASYRDYFRTRLRTYLGKAAGVEAWDRMTQANPARFLGLPLHGNTEVSAAILRHARFIRAHAAELATAPAAWVRDVE
jgi:predicted TIM-barrel fold metal-dependent hydrolase